MIDTILSIVNKFVPDTNEAQRLANELEQEYTKQMQIKSEIIRAEQKNGSGLWRVRLMYLCMIMVASHFLMYEVTPFIRTVFDLNFYTPMPPDNEHLWDFLYIGVGGYITSRGIEKGIARWRTRQ